MKNIIAPTWAGVLAIRFALQTAGMSPAHVELCIRLWLRSHLAKHAWPTECEHRKYSRCRLVRDAEERLHRGGVLDPARAKVRTIYDERLGELRNLGSNNVPVGVNMGRASTLDPKNHRWEYEASAARSIAITPTCEKKPVNCPNRIEVSISPDKRAGSNLWNKAIRGYHAALAILGVPVTRRYDFPVAYVVEKWSIAPTTGALLWTDITPHRGLDRVASDFDTVTFLLQLFHGGRLPLATEDDVRRLAFAIAAPFLRELCPGLLGVVWIVGPPGAGKDFLAWLVCCVWKAIHPQLRVPQHNLGSFENELEVKRESYAAAASGAIILRANEAGKRKGAADTLIRLSGAATIHARGMQQNDTVIPNEFLILADSAEEPPERKEIARRTLVIRAAPVHAGVKLAETESAVLHEAPAIMRSLQALIESKPPSFYKSQSSVGGRSPVHVAAAELFGFQLDTPKPRNLDALWEALLEYRCSQEAREANTVIPEAERKKLGARNATLRACKLSAAIDWIKGRSGESALYNEFSTATKVLMELSRETPEFGEYRTRRVPYISVEIYGQWYAFFLERDNRYYFLEIEADYCAAAGIPLRAVVPASETTCTALAVSQQTSAALIPGETNRHKTEYARDELLRSLSDAVAANP